jgi:uncharacterized protein (TIGR00251 family)
MNIEPVYRITPEGMLLRLHVQPGSSRAGFAGIYADRVKLKLMAKAVDGAANEAMRHFISEFFAVSKSCVTLVHGEKSRQKIVLIVGDSKDLEQRMQKVCDEAHPDPSQS